MNPYFKHKTRLVTIQRTVLAVREVPDAEPEMIRLKVGDTLEVRAENGVPVNRIRCLIVPMFPICSVECTDGSTVWFQRPPYCIETRGNLHLGPKYVFQ